ncbi:MAG: LLM class F420-dependent oxidoreductase [Rhodospirillaceae bacterium]|jgi:probable F420-dependent oxidoreductase|nr:LLM class F420-dependent oxidoreductase [Rhodospirillaceae bacterium]MBT6139671.1 LLM class F420-dependent oxidoreductase [Rhodospirillaceae bacterium]
MKFGLQLMTRGAGASADGVVAIAEKAEALGFSYIAPNDHIVVPSDIASRYPYSEDGMWPGAKVGECHEQLSVLAFLAARTSAIRLLTSVMVVPHRDPVLTAKILSTIDVLSRGRLTVGCGAGWMQEEFEAIGTPPFDERGRMTDEYVAIFKELWTQDDPSFDGAYAKFSNLHFSPRPVQTPNPPIWIGGESKAALRRAARIGDGWYPASNNPKFPLSTPTLFAERTVTLNQVCEEIGRDPGELDLGLFYIDVVSSDEIPDAGGQRRAMTGKPSDIAEDIAAFSAAGVNTMVMILQQQELPGTLDRLDWFGSEIMPLVGS